MKVLQYITGREIGEALAPKGGFISPWKDFDPAKSYPNETMRIIAEVAYASTGRGVRRLGHDAGRGRRRELLAGHGRLGRAARRTLDAVLKEIDDSWPAES